MTSAPHESAPAPEQLDLVAALGALSRVLAEHCRRCDTDETVLWASLGWILEASAYQCYDRAEHENAMG